jgi:hypothetical protein
MWKWDWGSANPFLGIFDRSLEERPTLAALAAAAQLPATVLSIQVVGINSHQSNH